MQKGSSPRRSRHRPPIPRISRLPVLLAGSGSIGSGGGARLALMGEFFIDPTFQLVPIDRRQVRQLGPQASRAANVDVVDVVLRLVGVPVQQNANAARQG